MSQLIEFIESYIKVGNDYQWNDNHGELIRCKDCTYIRSIDYQEGRNADERLWCMMNHHYTDEEKYCAWAERREE